MQFVEAASDGGERVMTISLLKQTYPALTHYAHQVIGPLYSTVDRLHKSEKPTGLWVSIDQGGEGWADWCRGEGYQVSALRHVHHLRLSKFARVLHLRDEADILRFAWRFGAFSPFGHITERMDWIDWPAVAETYQGIIIAPYCQSLRFSSDVPWYYWWDVASGCIWDTSAISQISRAGEKRSAAA